MPTHLVVDFTAPEQVLADKDLVCRFMLDAIALAEMQLLAGPYVWDTGSDDPNPGVTGFTIITTSHIAMHTFTKQLRGYMDLFSCQDFSVNDVVKLLKRLFLPGSLHSTIVPRSDIVLLHREFERPHALSRHVERKGEQ